MCACAAMYRTCCMSAFDESTCFNRSTCMSTSQSLLHTTRTCIGVHITRCRQESLVSLPPSLLNHTWLDDVCTYTHTCNTLRDTLTDTISHTHKLTPTNKLSFTCAHTHARFLSLSRALSFSLARERARAHSRWFSLSFSLAISFARSHFLSSPLFPSLSLFLSPFHPR